MINNIDNNIDNNINDHISLIKYDKYDKYVNYNELVFYSSLINAHLFYYDAQYLFKRNVCIYVCMHLTVRLSFNMKEVCKKCKDY